MLLLLISPTVIQRYFLIIPNRSALLKTRQRAEGVPSYQLLKSPDSTSQTPSDILVNPRPALLSAI